MKNYPTVNYIGNKEKICDWILDNLPIKEGVALDLFAGGNSVSYALKSSGFTVYTNDILYSNYVIGKGIIENNSDVLSPDVFDMKVPKTKINKKFKDISFLVDRLYFEEEVKELAKLLCIADALKENDNYLFLTILRRAMIRKLPYSRMNVPWNQITKLRDEEYSYQKYKRRRAYHNYTFEKHMRAVLDEFNNSIFDNKKENKVFREDAFEMVNKIDKVDLIYMDPPYPGTMNKYDDFYGVFDKMCGKELEHADFTNKNSFIDTMEELIKISCKKTDYIVISLNNKLSTIEEQLLIMLGRYGKVEKKEEQYSYKVTGKEMKNATKEILFILKVE